MSPEQGAALIGRPWFAHQNGAFQYWDGYDEDKLLVYYPTGKGKTTTMLMLQAMREQTEVLVIAPPITHEEWVSWGKALGITVEAISHAKFRMPDFKVKRTQAMIVDEFHLLGGTQGAGWKKLDRMAAGLKAPLILGSATPNYNDAERVYCLAHVLHPLDNRGGFEAWLHLHCKTVPSQFGRLPLVEGFLHYKDAAEFLSKMRGVVYLPDEAPDILVPVHIQSSIPDEFAEYSLDLSRFRIMASQMEQRQRLRYLQIVDPETRRVRPHVYDEMTELVGSATTPSLIFCQRSEVAKAVVNSLLDHRVSYGYIDGDTPKTQKVQVVNTFKEGKLDVLVGTASMATGTDGIDKMCDELIILDDTDDPSLRRQLVGRILPRGASVNYTGKYAHQFVYRS